MEKTQIEMKETLRVSTQTHEAARKLRNREKSLIYELKDAEKSEDDEEDLNSVGNTASMGNEVEIKDGEHNHISEFDSDQQMPSGRSYEKSAEDGKAEWLKVTF